MKEVVKAIHERAINFLSRVLADADSQLADAERLVLYYQTPDKVWRCVYLRMSEYHFAWVGAAMLEHSRHGYEQVDEGEA